MTQRLAARARIAVGAALAVLFVMVALLFARFSQQFEEARVLVRRTSGVIATTNSLFEAVLQSESSERGYLITGAPDYLQRYTQGRDRVPGLLSELRKLTIDNPQQQTQLDRLAPVIRQKTRRDGPHHPPARQDWMNDHAAGTGNHRNGVTCARPRPVRPPFPARSPASPPPAESAGYPPPGRRHGIASSARYG